MAKKHTLTLIGYLSGYTAYLDVPKTTALDRWRQENNGEPSAILTFGFDDQFGCYDAEPDETGEWICRVHQE